MCIRDRRSPAWTINKLAVGEQAVITITGVVVFLNGLPVGVIEVDLRRIELRAGP